jgi:hypothetical protein
MIATMRPGGWLAAGTLAVTLGFAVPAGAQSLRIPDFRTGRSVAPASKPGETCERCGTIRAIHQMQVQRPIPVPQAVRNDPIDRGPGSQVLVGAVVALPTGEGPGTKPFVGGVGTPEMRERFTETTYEIVVHFDSGAQTVLQRADGWGYSVGDRVRVSGMQLELLGP